MIFRRQKSVRAATSLLLALCITPGYVLGALTGWDSDANPKTATPSPKRQIAARLTVRGNLPALVNGNGSYTGATVLTGATIQTPGGVRATIQLGGLGSLDLSPNTIAVIDFSNDAVTGTLRKGCATLTATKNVSGLLLTPEGTSLSTEKMALPSVTACSADATAPAGSGAANTTIKPAPARPGIFGLNPSSTLALLGAGGLAASGAINHSAANTSGSNGTSNGGSSGNGSGSGGNSNNNNNSNTNNNSVTVVVCCCVCPPNISPSSPPKC